jgi:hypothetical protein
VDKRAANNDEWSSLVCIALVTTFTGIVSHACRLTDEVVARIIVVKRALSRL